MSYRPAAHVITASALLLCAGAAAADDAACAMQERDGLANNRADLVIPQLGTTCYGVKEEQNPLTQEIWALIDKDPTPERVALALRKLATRVRESDLYGPEALREKFGTNTDAAADAVAGGVPPGEPATSPIPWQVDRGSVKNVEGLDIVMSLAQACPQISSPQSEPCKGAIQTAKAWLRAVQLAETALTRYSAPTLDALLQRSTTRLAMWHAYRDEGLPQYPWEWLVNSARLNKADQRPGGRERDKDGQPIGPMKVPTSQLILLHPGVGLEYRDHPDKPTASGDSKTEPIVYLELLGRYRWSWNESTGAMLGGGGLSIVATYADREDDTKVGYGVLFHTRRGKAYTFGITRAGDSTNLIFNADFAEFFKDKLGYWKRVEEQATK